MDGWDVHSPASQLWAEGEGTEVQMAKTELSAAAMFRRGQQTGRTPEMKQQSQA